jgi:translocation and assembly module TamA
MKRMLFFLILFVTALYAKSMPLYFEGNEHFSDRKLYEVLSLYKPYSYEFYKDEPKLNPKIIPIAINTLKDFYKSKGYYHARVSSEIKKNGIYLHIYENIPVKIKKITIHSLLDIKQEIGFKVGDLFDAQKFVQSKKNIKKFYKNHGYANAAFKTKAYIDIQKNSANLLYEVTPNEICRFARIDINSSKNIDKKIIKSLLYFNIGDIYTPVRIERSYKNLYAYEGISQAIIKSSIYNKKDVAVEVNVQEIQKPIRFQIGAGFSSDEGLSGSVGIKHRNFFGNLKTLSLNAVVTQIKQSVKLNFTMPLTQRNLFGSEINFENEDFFGFKESRILVKGHFSQRDEFNWLQEGLVVDTSQSYDSSDKVLFPEQNLILTSPELHWIYDRRDVILNPSKGFFVDTQLQGSLQSSISNATYYKFMLSSGYILALKPNILAAKVKVGSLHTYAGDVPNSYRFFAGGMNSNRAYGYRLLGPKDADNNPTGFNSIIETTLEYRFHIFQKFKGVVFNDNSFLGQTYLPNKTTAYYGTGFGIRYETPIGPLAIDLGFDPKEPLKQHALHFHVGELF